MSKQLNPSLGGYRMKKSISWCKFLFLVMLITVLSFAPAGVEIKIWLGHIFGDKLTWPIALILGGIFSASLSALAIAKLTKIGGS